jgi:SAM-dependent methyltransferase
MISSWLSHPLTRGLDLDDPQTTVLRRRILEGKPFLKKLYRKWYDSLLSSLGEATLPVLEIGSGAGFLRQHFPALIASDIIYLPWLTLVLDAQRLPIHDQSLDGIVMTNVLHHMSDIEGFFAEATRCICVGGQMVMIEPWPTPWSKFIYSHFHHEPFDPQMREWRLDSAGSMTTANDALPWIVFERDRERFLSLFPEWVIEEIQPMTPFCYLLSGGMSLRSLMPGWTYAFWSWIERAFRPWMRSWAMFAKVVLRRLP